MLLQGQMQPQPDCGWEEPAAAMGAPGLRGRGTAHGRGCSWGAPALFAPSLLSLTYLRCETRPEPPAATATVLQNHIKEIQV